MRTRLHLPATAQFRGFRAVLILGFALHFTGCARGQSAQSESRAATSANPSEEEIRFVSGKITLAGTLVLPHGAERHPAVVLFHGSGPQERDLLTARWFAAQGIAALAYDKRGVGGSTGGDFRTVPFMDICDDGLAAVQYLKSRHEIDAKRIGVWGLSQGGWLGPLAASRSADIAFVIAVSGPGVSPGEQMIVYYAKELRTSGMAESDIQEAGTLRRELYEYLYTAKGYEKAKADLDRARARPWFVKVKSQQDKLDERLQQPSELNERDHPNIVRFAREMHYDPVPALQALRVPALFLFGDQDWMIPVEKSKEVIRQTLTQSGHPDFTIRTFHNVDHGMNLTTSGAVGDIAPEYLATMRTWLAARHFIAP
ncbi:MAG TPA: alpha/beta fold hydrolase [Candidatus Acidoferrales bacterium]|nr:alpha/beta fold hydrolase [Candidatus Acidoferrales bacterium]